MAIRLNPYLVMDGTAKEAITYYEQVLGAKTVSVQKFGEMPADPKFPPMPEVAKERISHALLLVGETELMLSDTFPGQSVHKGDHVTICITAEHADQARQLFDSLAQEGQVKMPLQETFWTSAYGIVIDRFGVTFQVTTQTASS